MWRQLSKKSVRGCRRASTNAKAPAPPPPAKPEANALPKAVPPKKQGSGNAVYGVLFATVTTAIGWGAYIKQNPQFNPEFVKDNEAWSKFREFVLTTVPPVQQLPEKVVVKPVEKKAEAKVPEKKAAVVEKKSAGVEKKEPKENVHIAKKKTVKVNETPAVKKEVDTAKKEVASNDKKTESKLEQVQAKVEEAKEKVEEAIVKAEAAVVAEVAAAKTAVKEKIAEVIPPLPAAIKKKMDDASAKEKAAIDALNAELVQFEEKAKEAAETTKNNVVKKARAEADALNEELDHTMLAGIKEMDADMLRLRVAQLITEMKHRTKWEAMRLMESLKRMEEDVQTKHLALLQEQEKLHKELLSRELRLQEEILTRTAREELDTFRADHEAQLSLLVNQQQALIQAEYDKKVAAIEEESDAKLQALINEKAEELETKYRNEQESRIAELEQFRVELKAVNELLGQTSNYEAFSHQVHKVSVAALALTDRIEAAAPLHSEVRALEAAGRGDHLIEAAVKSLAPYADGVPSVAQLQDRFSYVRNAGRRAALVPEESKGMVGHLFAGALLWLLIPPGGPIKGDDAEAIFSRADYALRAGDIETTVKELDKLSGLSREVVKDWVDAAKSRLAIEQTSKVVKAHVSLLAASLS